MPSPLQSLSVHTTLLNSVTSDWIDKKEARVYMKWKYDPDTWATSSSSLERGLPGIHESERSFESMSGFSSLNLENYFPFWNLDKETYLQP